MYQQHQKPEIKELIEPYKIGKLAGGSSSAQPAMQNPYAAEPERHPALVYRSERPCNAETPGHILAANLITPTDVFYVRNHLPVPEVDMASYKLRVEGEGIRTVEFTLDELKSKFKKHTVAATVQCAGRCC